MVNISLRNVGTPCRDSHFLFRFGPLVGNTIDDFLPLRFSTFFLPFPFGFPVAGLASSTSIAAGGQGQYH